MSRFGLGLFVLVLGCGRTPLGEVPVDAGVRDGGPDASGFDAETSSAADASADDAGAIDRHSETLVIRPQGPVSVISGSSTPMAAFVRLNGSLREVTAEVMWASDDNAIASVINGSRLAGQVTGDRVGITNVRATYQGLEAFIEVRVTARLVSRLSVAPSSAIVTVGAKQVFQVDAFYNNGNFYPRYDERLSADGVNIAPTDFDSQFELITLSSKISGPIIRDKAWFIISYQSARSVIANIGVPQARDYEGHYVLTKLTWQPTPEHRFTGFMQTDPTVIDNIDQSGPFIKADSQGRQAQGGFVLNGR